VLTLGLFTLVINALMLMLTAWLTPAQLTTEGFLPALLGGIVISIVSLVLSMFLSDNR
jgi:putative membrane protein